MITGLANPQSPLEGTLGPRDLASFHVGSNNLKFPRPGLEAATAMAPACFLGLSLHKLPDILFCLGFCPMEDQGREGGICREGWGWELGDS